MTHHLMARFNAWANERLFDSIETLSAQDYRADRGLFFGSVHHTLNHLLLVDLLWRARLEGREVSAIRSLDQILYDAFEPLRAARLAEDAALVTHCRDMRPGSGGEEVRFSNLSGEGSMTMSRDEILVTLFNHQTHHRGQIHCVLTQKGIVPPPLDVIDYLYPET